MHLFHPGGTWPCTGSPQHDSPPHLYFDEFLLEPPGFVVGHQRIHNRAELSVHDFGELVNGQPDAMVGDAVLREIIRAHFLLAVAALDLPPTLRAARTGLLLFP